MRNVNHNPLRKVSGKVRRVLGETEINGQLIEVAVFDEQLECGHVQSVRQDIYGETFATKRRCEECGREMTDAEE